MLRGALAALGVEVNACTHMQRSVSFHRSKFKTDEHLGLEGDCHGRGGSSTQVYIHLLDPHFELAN